MPSGKVRRDTPSVPLQEGARLPRGAPKVQSGM